jgi:hypothetical protein
MGVHGIDSSASFCVLCAAVARVLTPEHSSTHLWASLVYATFDEAFEAASEMNGQELDGRLLRVSIVDPPTAGESESDNDASEPRQ